MKIIAVANQKGGVAKTTTSLAIMAGLYNAGYKVLAVDLDAQGNLSTTLNADKNKPSVLDVMTGKASVTSALQETDQGFLLASDKKLTGVKTISLPNALTAVQKRFDVCIIDTSPALDVLTINALASANACIVPVKADRYSVDALADFSVTFNDVKARLNTKLSIMGFIITQFNPRTTINNLILEDLQAEAKTLKTKIYKPAIRKCIALEEAQYTGNIFTYAPRSNASKDYQEVVNQIIKDLKKI